MSLATRSVMRQESLLGSPHLTVIYTMLNHMRGTGTLQNECKTIWVANVSFVSKLLPTGVCFFPLNDTFLMCMCQIQP